MGLQTVCQVVHFLVLQLFNVIDIFKKNWNVKSSFYLAECYGYEFYMFNYFVALVIAAQGYFMCVLLVSVLEVVKLLVSD